MEKYKQRLIAEYIELHNRYCAAVDALFDESIPADDRDLIREQAKYMKEYEYVLKKRMERAGVDLYMLNTVMGYQMQWRFV